MKKDELKIDIVPLKDFAFNGGGFTGHFWKGKKQNINAGLATYLRDKKLVQFSKDKKED